MATVFAGPGAARHLADFGADVVKVESPARRRRAPHGLVPARGRRLVHVEAARPEQARRRARPQDRRRPRRAARASPTTPTCSSRTSGPARSSGSASGPTCCSRATRASSCCASPASARTVRTRRSPGFATMAEAMSGFAAINGEPDGAAAAPADRAHRRGRRARGRVRGDGRAARARPHRRGPGRRREPARVDAADDVGAAVGRRAPRLRAAAARFGHPVLGAARHVPVRRRRVGRDLDVGRVGRAPRARRCSASATTRASRPSRVARRAPRGARRGSSARGSARARRPRCSPRSKRPRPRSRPCTRCASCSPTRTCRRATCSSRSTAS